MAGSGSTEPGQGQRVGGRFLLQELLGRGAQSVVWLARDLGDRPEGAEHDPAVVARARKVALKLLCPKPRRGRSTSQVRPADLLRVRHEATALASIGHPAIVELVHAGLAGDQIYLALEHCPGESLESLITSGRTVPPPQVARWGAELAEALALAHDQGILHRDIKPGNLLVDQGRIRLLDFGMASVRGMHDDLDRGVILGTLPYMPLEAWGLGSGPPDGRSDLYALAATLYEALTGRRAFAGSSPSEVLERHRRGAPRDPCRLVAAAPRPLGDVLLRALSRDPSDRYQTASGLAADLRRAATEIRSFPLGRHDHATRLVVPDLVGRDLELRRLERLVERAARGIGGVALVASPPGGGRSRLLEQVARSARAGGALVLSGRCHGLQHDLPYDPIVQLLAHFRAQLGLLGGAEREARLVRLRRKLEGWTDPLLTLVPSLGEALGAAARPAVSDEPLEGVEGRRRFVESLRDAILGTAAPGRPTVVLLDDVHRADRATRDLLLEVARSVAEHAVLVVVSAGEADVKDPKLVTRSLDGPARDFLVDLAVAAGPAFAHVPLPGLGDEAMTGLVCSMLRTGHDAVADVAAWIGRAAEGSPLRAVQLVRSLEETGAIVRQRDRWRIEPERVRGATLPDSLAEGIRLRIAALPPRFRSALAAAAVLGPRFRTDQLARVLLELGTGPKEVLHALDAAARAGLIEPDGGLEAEPGRHLFPHELVRRELAATWPLSSRAALHAAAARVLAEGHDPERLDDARLFAVARHALGAPDPRYAVPLALRAGHRALASFASETALSLFTVVARLAPDDALRREALLGQSEALLQSGRLDGALGPLDAALELCTSPMDRAEVLVRRAEVRCARAAFLEVDRDLREASRLLGEPCPAGPARAWLTAARELILHPLVLWRLRSRRQGRPTDRRRLLLAKLLQVAGRSNWFRRPELGVVCTLRGLRIALQGGATELAARTAGTLAVMVACALGWTWLAARLLHGADRLLGATAGRQARATLLGHRGMVDFFAGRPATARPRLEKAADEMGESPDRRLVLSVLGLTLRDRGELDGFRQRMESLHHASTDAGRDEQGLAWAAFGLAWHRALTGQPLRALDQAGPPIEAAHRMGDHPFAVAALGRRARMAAAAGRIADVLTDAERVEELVTAHRLRGWFALEGQLAAAQACVEVGELDRAERLLPGRRVFGGLRALRRVREAVAGQLILARTGSPTRLAEAARALGRAGQRQAATTAWLALRRRPGAERREAEEALREALADCPGLATTSLGSLLATGSDEVALRRSADKLGSRLDSLTRKKKDARRSTSSSTGRSLLGTTRLNRARAEARPRGW
jgi:hypothetical protein